MVVARKTNYFFFSSRRRHTRLQGDWSSDVCSSDLYHYPQESVLPGMDARQTLAWHTWQGAAGRYSEGISQKGRQQMHNEVELISLCGYEKYFLTLPDIVRFARRPDIPCPGPGSAAH